VTAERWINVPTDGVVPTVTLSGTYLTVRDQRIELTVTTITDSLGQNTADGLGFVGRYRIRFAWNSIHESRGGTLDIPRGYSGQPLRFDVPIPGSLPDTTMLSGLRVAFRVGDKVRVQDSAVFDVEDFEGWHVWRWGADPTSPSYQAVGEYSKLVDVAAAAEVWPGHSPTMRRVTFVDRNVFDGFLYHYAITSYDQGFKRANPGDLAQKFDSPLHLATRNPDGSVTLGSTQIEVSFRRPPPSSFEPIAAVPNPFRESESIATAPETQVVQFINSPPRGTLLIWTLSGDLVRTITQEQTTVGVLEWDTRNEAGEKVTSGVYIYKIIDLVSGQESFGRLVIIR